MRKINKSLIWLSSIATICLTGCSFSSQGDYLLQVQLSNEKAGTITGGGYYDEGDNFHIFYELKDGYEFNGFYNQGKKLTSESDFKMPENNTIIIGKVSLIEYSITYSPNGGVDRYINPFYYTVEDEITLFEPTKEGAVFGGWQTQYGNIINKIEKGTTGNLYLRAVWITGKYKVNAVYDTSCGTVEGIKEYEHLTEATLTAKPNANSKFCGWYEDPEYKYLIGTGSSYKVKVEGAPVTVYAKFLSNSAFKAEEEARAIKLGAVPHRIDANYYTFGSYAKTFVSDKKLRNILEGMQDQKDNNGYVYYNYKYYKNDYMNNSNDFTYSDGSSINDSSQWFEVEAIKWRVLETNNITHEALVIADEAFDCFKQYSSSHRNETRTSYDGQTGTCNPSNYLYSDVRTYLNTKFIDLITFKSNVTIKSHYFNNSPATTALNSNPDACNDTYDKVALPSYKDMKNESYGFVTEESRKFYSSEYGRACSQYRIAETVPYMTRSPNGESYVSYVNSSGQLGSCPTSSSENIRPMLYLPIE